MKILHRRAWGALAAITMAIAATAQDAPLMGWSSWNTYALDISDQLIREQADAMVSTGLKDAGYKYVNIDDGFWNGRAGDGTLLIDSVKFPNGMRAVADYIHSVGLKAGIYSDAGDNTCGSGNKRPYGLGVGLYGYEDRDCKTYFIDWNYDFIKVDYCGGNHARLNEKEQYTRIADAIRNCGRDDIHFNICRWAYPGTWAAGLADSWRTTGDIYNAWTSVRDIIAENLYMSAYCHDGHYNDMDMLEVGRDMTAIEDATHYAMWCMMSSPLLVGCDMRNMKPETIALLTNADLVAVNQDPLHLQAYVAYGQDGCYVMVKDLETRFGTVRAVAVYNPTDEAHRVAIDFARIELGGDVMLRDLMARKNLGKQKGGIYEVDVPAHGTAVFRAEGERRLERSRYEAENGYMTAYQELYNNATSHQTGVVLPDASCSGGVKTAWLGNDADNDLRFNDVYSLDGGRYDLVIAYMCGNDRSFVLEVNGRRMGEWTVNSGADGKVATLIVPVTLNRGVNYVRLCNARSAMPDFDYIEVTPVR